MAWDLRSKGIHIHFYWTTFYIGVRGNAMVDNLTKKAMVHGEIPKLGPIYLPLIYTDTSNPPCLPSGKSGMPLI